MIAMIEWGCSSSTAIMCLTVGALLMYWRMARRLDRAVAAEHHYGEWALTKQRQGHKRAFDQLARDHNALMDDQRHAVVVCKRLASDIAQLTVENDALRNRLARTTAAMNAWGPKTERGQA